MDEVWQDSCGMNDLSSTACVFCAIASGTGDASLVYEDPLLIGFLDINPVNEGHLLIAPKSHVQDLADLPPETLAAMATLAQRLAAGLRVSGLRCEGVNLFYADGEAAGQEVFHSHLHVIPRYDGDPFQITADWDSPPSRSTLDRHADLIREALYSRS